MTAAGPSASNAVHPLIVRVTHWLNAIAVTIMIMSGWQTYNASPIFPFSFPSWMTLGGWLGGAILWHFATMWLLMANGLMYLAYGVASNDYAKGFGRARVTAGSPGFRPFVWRRRGIVRLQPRASRTSRRGGSVGSP